MISFCNYLDAAALRYYKSYTLYYESEHIHMYIQYIYSHENIHFALTVSGEDDDDSGGGLLAGVVTWLLFLAGPV